MNSPMFKLKAIDFGKGLITAALTAVITLLAQWVNVPGFDFTTINWTLLWQAAVAGGLGYLAKNFFSDKDGKFAGI
jgi:hypothetical protein